MNVIKSQTFVASIQKSIFKIFLFWTPVGKVIKIQHKRDICGEFVVCCVYFEFQLTQQHFQNKIIRRKMNNTF